MTKVTSRTIALATLWGCSLNANAIQVLGDHSVQNHTQSSRLGIVFSHAEVDIEATGGSSELEVDSIGVDYSKRYDGKIDLIAQAAIIYDTEQPGCDGSGFQLGAGARNFIASVEKIDIYAYGLLNYASVGLDCTGGGDVDITMLSLHAGPVATYTVNPKVSVYSAIDLALFSDGTSDPSGAGEVDLELNDIFNLNIGARGTIQQFNWQAKIGLIGEQSISVGLGQSF